MSQCSVASKGQTVTLRRVSSRQASYSYTWLCTEETRHFCYRSNFQRSMSFRVCRLVRVSYLLDTLQLWGFRGKWPIDEKFSEILCDTIVVPWPNWVTSWGWKVDKMSSRLAEKTVYAELVYEQLFVYASPCLWSHSFRHPHLNRFPSLSFPLTHVNQIAQISASFPHSAVV